MDGSIICIPRKTPTSPGWVLKILLILMMHELVVKTMLREAKYPVQKWFHRLFGLCCLIEAKYTIGFLYTGTPFSSLLSSATEFNTVSWDIKIHVSIKLQTGLCKL